MSEPAYWTMVSYWERKRLWVFNWIFRRRDEGRELQQLGATFYTVLRSILKQLLFAVLLAAGLVSLDSKFPITLPETGTVERPVAQDVTPQAPAVLQWASPLPVPTLNQADWQFSKFDGGQSDWNTFLANSISIPAVQPPRVHKPVEIEGHPIKQFLAKLSFRSDAVLSILSTLAPMAATMLGLYFAAVSLVVSTSYNKVPGEVRALFVKEQVGSHYFTFLAQFGANALLLLLAYTIGFPVGLWSVCCVLLLGVVGVFSFISLGLRTFAFFDPAALLGADRKSVV